MRWGFPKDYGQHSSALARAAFEKYWRLEPQDARHVQLQRVCAGVFSCRIERPSLALAAWDDR